MGQVKKQLTEEQETELAEMFSLGDYGLYFLSKLPFQEPEKEPIWLQRWHQKFSDSDYMAEDSGEYCERS